MVPGWQVFKRYSQFAELRQTMAGKLRTVALPQLPAKRFLVTQTKAETRREHLEVFLQKLLKVPDAAISSDFLSFLQVPQLLQVRDPHNMDYPRTRWP